MSKLKGLPSVLTRLPPKVAFLNDDGAEASRMRDRSLAWRAWYKTARWQRLRMQVLVGAAFTCVMCGRVAESSGMVADHITPHRGNAALFWDRGNLQAICKPCHDSAKQRAERQGGGKRVGPPPA